MAITGNKSESIVDEYVEDKELGEGRLQASRNLSAKGEEWATCSFRPNGGFYVNLPVAVLLGGTEAEALKLIQERRRIPASGNIAAGVRMLFSLRDKFKSTKVKGSK